MSSAQLFDPALVQSVRLEPVQLEIVGECEFKAKPCGNCGKPKSNKVHSPKSNPECQFKRQIGCANCGRNKGDRVHFGLPPSFNVMASGMGSGNAMVYAGAKAAWEDLLMQELKRVGLQRGLLKVFAEGELTFPSHRSRDQGNFRVILEKALGDALQNGGWLDSDDWDHYEFGGLTQAIRAGESATRVVLFPTAKEES